MDRLREVEGINERKRKSRHGFYYGIVICLLTLLLGSVNVYGNDTRPAPPVRYSNEDAVKKIAELSGTNPDYKEIYDNIDKYPKELLRALCSNSELLEFVRDYPEGNGEEANLTLTEIFRVLPRFPRLVQWDERWGYETYGETNIGLAGCGPTCVSMVSIGLTKNYKNTPNVVSKYSFENGYYVPNVGTSWDLMTTGSKNFGIKGESISNNWETISKHLKEGNPIIASMRPGNFTTGGHFIVFTGLCNGEITINDPNSKIRSDVTWDYDSIKDQIKGLWVFICQ